MKVYSESNHYSHFGILEENQEEYNLAMGKPKDYKVLPQKQALIDGYNVGDKVLEGVNIILTVEDDGKLSAQFKEEDKFYTETLNEEHWLKLGLQFAEEGGDWFQGFNGDQEIDLILKDGTINQL